jgi:hypothetical protein
MDTRYTFSEEARNRLRVRFRLILPVLIALPALLLWVHVLRPWPDVTRQGVAMVVAATMVAGWFVARSARQMARVSRGELDIVTDGAALRLPGTEMLRPDQVEWVGAFELPMGPRRAMLRVLPGDQPGAGRPRSVAVDLGSYEHAEELEQLLENFAGPSGDGESVEN